MESHEEKLLAMVQESKMNQAREIMKQKERELKSHQPAASGLSFFTSLFSSAVSNVASTVRAVDSSVSGASMAGSGSDSSMAGSSSASSRAAWAPREGVRVRAAGAASLGSGLKLGGAKKASLQVGARRGVDRRGCWRRSTWRRRGRGRRGRGRAGARAAPRRRRAAWRCRRRRSCR